MRKLTIDNCQLSIVNCRWSLGILRFLLLLLVLTTAGCINRTSTSHRPKVPVLSDQLLERHNRAVALMGRFQYGEAREVFAQLVQEYPDWLEAKVDLAIATLNRQEQGDDREAARLLDAVLAVDPHHPCALYCRGLLYLYAGQPTDALALFRQVAQADPADAYAAYYAGQCLLESSQLDQAFAEFQRAGAIDPYLRSAYYGAFQAAQRSGQVDQARQYLEQFQKLEKNPQSRLAEIKYTRMGPKAEVRPLDAAPGPIADIPAGAVFAEPVELVIRGGEEIRWRRFDPSPAAPTVTICDIDGDARVDLFLTAAREVDDGLENVVLLQREDGFQLEAGHPLAKVHDVNAALWGDYDNDGLTDAYLCRRGPNQLWRQVARQRWENASQATKTDGGERNTVDGAMFDSDHDGDLDLMLVNDDGPNELLSNNRDGTFRPLAAEHGLAGSGSGSRSIVVADLDNDRDADILIVNREPPHEVYLNDRLWSYRPAHGFDRLRESPIEAAVAADTDADGQVELVTVAPDGITRWSPNERAQWVPERIPIPLPSGASAAATAGPIATQDVDGDGRLDLLVSTDRGWLAFALEKPPRMHFGSREFAVHRWTTALLDPERGPSAIGLRSGQPPLVWKPGPGRFPFAVLSFTGREDVANQMRSNASGIGVTGAVRWGSRFTAFDTYRRQSGPGQSLQPLAMGLGGAKRFDFVWINWPDGVFQTELDLAGGQAHRIEETQRQISSCPVVFVWNGEAYQFVTDVLGVGGIGFHLGPGQYSTPRPWENHLLPAGLLVPKDEVYQIKLGEPMEEACYLDSVRLVAYDLPPGWHMTLDERLAVNEPWPTGEPIYYRQIHKPTSAVNDRQQDVTERIAIADRRAAPPGAPDRRFIGRTDPHAITLTFAQPLDALEGQPVLVMDGWIEYPYSQTMFAAWQAGAEYMAPTIHARGADGRWHVVLDQFGYLAGMPRQAAVPLPRDRLPRGTTQLRIETNMEIYWDRLALASGQTCSGVVKHSMPLRQALVRESGFAERHTGVQKQPDFDYSRRVPLWDTRHQAGFYTRFGPATALVAHLDDALAIIGPGEEVHLEFEPVSAECPAGWTREFVLETYGWCKDMDLFTKDGEAVAPLPQRDPASKEYDGRRDHLHRALNTRFRSGT
jgi:tetratricopeptide (TPR) repeat protein